MKQFFTKINIDSSPGKLTEFTDDVMKELSNHHINNGLATLYIKHTSASLLIQENADPDVLYDLENSKKPSELLINLVKNGKLGVKSGQGFQNWTNNEIEKTKNRVSRYLRKIEKII